MLHIAGVNYDSMVDGEGVRAAIFLSGCPHHCEGCHNRDAQNPEYGTPVTYEVIQNILTEISKRPYLSGITLTGGDPFYDVQETAEFLWVLRTQGAEELKRLNIWIYTGYTIEELTNMKDAWLMSGKDEKYESIDYLLSMCDMLVDGRFDQSKADKRLKFRGSSNQRIIDIARSRAENKVILWKSSESW